MTDTSMQKDGHQEEVTEKEKTGYLSIDNLKNRLEYVKKLKEDGILKNEKHYRVAEETGKYFLIKSGAELIATAFNLRSDFEIQTSIEQPQKSRYITSENGIKTHIKGYWSYTVKSILYHKRTNENWGSCLGACNSGDKGYEMANQNTIIRMAGKRAFVGSIIIAAGCSNLFIIDEEVIEKLKNNDKIRKKSKFGTKNKPVFCKACKTKHILRGDKIIFSSDHNAFIAEKCIKSDPRMKNLTKYTKDELLKMIIKKEISLLKDVAQEDHMKIINRERKRAVNNGLLELIKMEKNLYDNLIKYYISLVDKIRIEV